MTHSTGDLMKLLNQVETPRQLDDYAAIASSSSTYSSCADFLKEKIRLSSMQTGEVIRLSGIQRNYAYQILEGKRQPGRDKVISFCLALSLPLDDVQRALTLAGEASLYPKRSRDAVLIYCIHQHLSVIQANALLDERGEKPLA